MMNFKRPHVVKQIVPSIMDIQSSKEFQELLIEQNLTKLYVKFIIPLHKELVILHNDMKISTAQYNMRMVSIMNVLQLIEDFISKNQYYNKTTIFLIKDIQMSPFYLKIVQGLLHTEHIHPLFIEVSNSNYVAHQLINEHKADSLFLIDEKIHEKVVTLPYLHGVRVRFLAYYELERLINSLPSNSNKSIQIYNWLCATHSI